MAKIQRVKPKSVEVEKHQPKPPPIRDRTLLNTQWPAEDEVVDAIY
jgi:hypothetical protein